MNTIKAPVHSIRLGIISLVLGILGFAFYWWTPLGVVLGLFGFVLGFAGWALAPQRTDHRWLVIAAMLVCLAVVVFDVEIGLHGLEIVKFGALR
jgi:hypothetical protein